MKIIMRRDCAIFSHNSAIGSAKGDVFLIKEFNQKSVLEVRNNSFHT